MDVEDTEENEEVRQRRAAERLRVLEAAGIVTVGNETRDAIDSTDPSNEQTLDGTAAGAAPAQNAENLLGLKHRASNRKVNPESPERSFTLDKPVSPTKGKLRKDKPHRPNRRPPPPPKEKKHEEEMEDAYDRFVKLSQQLDQARSRENQQIVASPSAQDSARNGIHTANAANPPSISASPPPQVQGAALAPMSTSVVSAGSGLLSSIKNRIGAGGAVSPGERKATPSISGPMSHGSGRGIGSPPPTSTNQYGERSRSSSASTVVTPTGVPAKSDITRGGAPLAGAYVPHSSTWTSFMGSDAVSDIPEAERKRQEAIFELIATESTHVRDLQIVVQVFFDAIQPLLNAKAATVIFANIEDILLAAVSLMSDLEARQRSERLFITQIGDILETHMAGMSVYIPYCVNQETAAQILAAERTRNTEIEDTLKRLRNEHPSARGLDLSHFLLTPSTCNCPGGFDPARVWQSATSEY